MMAQVNENLLREIDNLELSDRIRQWQKAMKGCPSQIYVDRQKLALESWKETEGEDIEIRRAKLFKKIVETVIYTDTFFRNGGQHIQFNIVDTRELLDAKVNPENHKDLIVRVGGFSAYFVQLSPEVQDDIILRTEHSL